MVTLLWSFCVTVAIALAAVCGWLWLSERRDRASLMLCLLGAATAGFGYVELGFMHSTTAAEYGEWHRWYHVPLFLGFVSIVFFAHYYLETGRLWLLWTIILMRSVVLIVNFVVHPNFNYASVDSLRRMSLLGEQISIIAAAVPRTHWQMFATASLILVIAYLVDAGVKRWRKGGPDARRKALAVILGMALPLIGAILYSHLVLFGLLRGPVSNFLWSLSSLLMMVYELGRDAIIKKHAQFEFTELREQLAHAARVSALGQLSSALAHELSQPLTATAANAGAALAWLKGENPDLKELRSILEDIRNDGRRAVEIITRMRQLSQRHVIDMQPINVEDVARDVVSLVHSEATLNNVIVRLAIPPGLPSVLGDRVHVSQVLLNLLMNSIQAVQSRPLDARRIVVEARFDDSTDEVELAVRDSGPGIPDSIANDVFMPFFTTKPEGMGIGLALSRTIIEAHGGRLWTDRKNQQDGATLRFTLKRA